MITVYLAAPIDKAVGNSELVTRRWDTHRELASRGANTFDPHAAWTNNPPAITAEAASKIQDVNMHALEHADLVIALAPPDVPTVGVPIEVVWALTQATSRVAVWAGSAPSSAWLWLANKYPSRVRIIYGLEPSIIDALVTWVEAANDDDPRK